MCGLTGFSGKKPYNKDLIKSLMLWNSLERGKDSTGIYTPKNGLVKTTDEAYKFLMDNSFKDDKMFIGHVRASTVGSKSVKNAHPFLENGVVLAHNGTLKNHWALCHKYGLSMQDYDVDSHVIDAILGKEQNFNVLKDIEGAAALLITNQKTPEFLYVFRNGERPLFRGVLDKDMYISSIKESLEYIGCANVIEFKENTVYTIKDGGIISTQKIKNTPFRWSNPSFGNNNAAKFIPLADLNKTWLKCNRTTYSFFNKPAELTNAKFYYVEDINVTDSAVLVNDNRGKAVWIPKYCFDFEDCLLSNGAWVIVLTDLSHTSDKTKSLFKKDDIVDIIKYYSSFNTVALMSTQDGGEYTVPTKFVRRLTKREEDAYTIDCLRNESCSNNLPILNNQPTFPFREHEMGIEFATEEYLNEEDALNPNPSPIITDGSNALEEEDITTEHENEGEEEEDDGYYDLMINSGEIAEALAELDETSEALLNYGAKNLPADKVNDFMLLINKLQERLLDCEERFCFSAEEIAEQNNEVVEETK